MPYKDAMIRQMEEKIQALHLENDLLKLNSNQKVDEVKFESLMDMLNQAAQDAMDITKAQEEDQSSAEMRDSNGDELWPEDDFGTTESEDFDDAISTDDRIYQAFEQITNRSIDNFTG